MWEIEVRNWLIMKLLRAGRGKLLRFVEVGGFHSTKSSTVRIFVLNVIRDSLSLGTIDEWLDTQITPNGRRSESHPVNNHMAVYLLFCIRAPESLLRGVEAFQLERNQPCVLL